MPRKSVNYAVFLFTYYAYAGSFATFAALFFAARGMSVTQIGVLVSLIQVMRIFGPNVWGWVADHTQKRSRVLRMTAVAALLVFCAFFWAHTFVQFFAVMVVLNLFTSAQSPLSEALMLADMRGDLSNYGKLRLWGSVGFIAAVTLGGYVLDWFGVESLLLFCVALLIMVLAASLPIRDVAHPEAGHDAPRLWQVLRKPEVATFFLSTALMCGAHMALYAFYSLYLERAGYGKPVIGAMWALGVVAEVLFFFFQARVFARFGAQRVMMWTFALALLRFVITGAGADFLWVLVLAQLLHAATFAAHHSSSVLTMQRWFAGPLQASGQALYMSIAYGLGGTFGGLFLTLCWDKLGPGQMYYVAAAMSVAAAAAAWTSFRLQARD
ncbi:MAG: MFS transporter [Massilia sp.]